MFTNKRRMSRREFLRLGSAGCGGGEGTGENTIGWQTTCYWKRTCRGRRGAL